MAAPTALDLSDGRQGRGSEDDDAVWTVIPVRRSRRKGHGTATAAMNFDERPVPVSARSTATGILHIQQEHAQVVSRWREQPSHRDLHSLVSAQAPSHAPVTQAVCLGTGSFGGPLDAGEHVRRAHIQTEAFLLIVDLLGAYRPSWAALRPVHSCGPRAPG